VKRFKFLEERPMKKIMVLALLAVSWVAVRGEAVVNAGKFFEKGKTRMSVTGGWGQAFSQDYFVIGAGAGYYVLPGFEIGVDGETWVGNSPHITKVTPEARYIFQNMGSVFPYLGGFYRRTFYEDLDDADSAGARAGVYMPLAHNVYFGVGGVFERQMDCDKNVYDNCSVLYPEFALTVAF
jgi:hypothetical protein